MSQSRKRRGMDTQNQLAKYFRANGWPWAESTGAGRPGADLTGTPDVAIECKARADFNPVGWLKQAEKVADGRLPIAVSRPNGVGPHPEKFIAHVRLGDLVPILRAAGYGDRPEETP